METRGHLGGDTKSFTRVGGKIKWARIRAPQNLTFSVKRPPCPVKKSVLKQQWLEAIVQKTIASDLVLLLSKGDVCGSLLSGWEWRGRPLFSVVTFWNNNDWQLHRQLLQNWRSSWFWCPTVVRRRCPTVQISLLHCLFPWGTELQFPDFSPCGAACGPGCRARGPKRARFRITWRTTRQRWRKKVEESQMQKAKIGLFLHRFQKKIDSPSKPEERYM